MTRHDSAKARAQQRSYALDQISKQHRTRTSSVAATLKQRARAARMTGLESVTLHLPIGDATLIATALTEWAARGARDETRAAITDRKGATS